MDRTIEGTLILVNSSRFGGGNPRLGEKLMKDFLAALNQKEEAPAAILFVNSAISLVQEESPVAEEINALSNAGVKILSEASSLNFYNMTGSLLCGSVVDMDEISDLLLEADKVITIA